MRFEPDTGATIAAPRRVLWKRRDRFGVTALPLRARRKQPTATDIQMRRGEYACSIKRRPESLSRCLFKKQNRGSGYDGENWRDIRDRYYSCRILITRFERFSYFLLFIVFFFFVVWLLIKYMKWASFLEIEKKGRENKNRVVLETYQ